MNQYESILIWSYSLVGSWKTMMGRRSSGLSCKIPFVPPGAPPAFTFNRWFFEVNVLLPEPSQSQNQHCPHRAQSVAHFNIWLVVYLPLWKIWVRQLGWRHSPYMEKQVPNHQPAMNSWFLPFFQWTKIWEITIFGSKKHGKSPFFRHETSISCHDQAHIHGIDYGAAWCHGTIQGGAPPGF